MTFLYTARAIFDNTHRHTNGMNWDKYLEWSKLIHLTELVSLDGMLNEILVGPDYEDGEDWNFIHNCNQYQTGFFTTLDYVFKRLQAKEDFNLIMVVIEPNIECKEIVIDGFKFIGYELLDQDFGISALSNCGGFDETFLPSDLNDKGLVNSFNKAYDIKRRLLENNPEEHHADTNVIAVWRKKWSKSATN